MIRSFPIVTIVLLFVAIAGCGESRTQSEQNVVNTLTYAKDHRTGLCFAIPKSRGWSVANVPCDKVEKYLVEK